MSRPSLATSSLCDTELIGLTFVTLSMLLGLFLQGAYQDEHVALIAPSFIFMGVVLIVFSWALRGRMGYRLFREYLPLAVWLAVSALSLGVASYMRPAVLALVNFAAFAGVFVIATQTLNSKNRAAVTAILAGAAACAIALGMAQDLFIFESTLKQIQKDPSIVARELHGIGLGYGEDFKTRLGSGEVYSFFILSNTFAGFLLLMIPVFLGSAWDALRLGKGAQRLAGIIPGVLAACALYLMVKTHSKGAWLIGGLLAVGFLAWAAFGLFRGHRKAFWGLTAAGALALSLGVFFGWSRIADAFGVRWGFYLTALLIWIKHPIAGVGLGNFGEYYFLLKPAWAHEVRTPHSLFLQALAETGIIGLAACIGTWGLICYRVLVSRKVERERPPFQRGPVVACIIGAAGAFLLAYVLRAFSWAMVAGCGAAFAAAFAGQLLIPVGNGLKKGIALGLFGLVLHSAMDIDLSVPGLSYIGAAAAALALQLNTAPPRAREFGLSSARATALILLATIPFMLYVYMVARPLSQSSADYTQSFLASDQAQRLKLLNVSAESDPGFAQPRLEIAEVAAARYVETGSQEDRSLAEGYFAAAERLRPLWSTVHQRWADMCDRRMQKTGLSPDLMEKAMLHYDKAIELYPSNPWFYYYRGLLAERASGEWPSYAKVAFDSYKAAMEYYEKVGNLHLIFPPQTYLNIGARIKGLAENLGVQPPPMPKVRK